jgi:acid phosphatase (class A)
MSLVTRRLLIRRLTKAAALLVVALVGATVVRFLFDRSERIPLFVLKRPFGQAQTFRSPRFERDPFEREDGRAVPGAIAETLTFSNTMQWDARLLPLLVDQSFYFGTSWVDHIKLPPPPANSSARTRRELDMLVSYSRRRDPSTTALITKECGMGAVLIGDYTLSEYMDNSKFAATAALLSKVNEDFSKVVMRMKKQFNRVRPHFLQADINPTIDVPGHPAYPSGHSSQAHLFARILGELMPSRRADFLKSAFEVAVRREIAGVHYPSDTAAGALLAESYFRYLSGNPDFLTAVAKARYEWHPDRSGLSHVSQ